MTFPPPTVETQVDRSPTERNLGGDMIANMTDVLEKAASPAINITLPVYLDTKLISEQVLNMPVGEL